MHLRHPALLLLLAVTLVACGDDEPRDNPGAAVGQSCFVDGDCADGLSCVERACQDSDAPDDAPNNDAPPNNDPANNDGDPVNNDVDMPECDTGSVDITTPATGTALTNNDDDDPEEPGVQIAVRVAASLPEGSILAVENLTTRQSAGARLQGNEAIVRGLTLTPGTNRLQALASGQGCAVRSQEVTITLQAPEVCRLDEDCPRDSSAARAAPARSVRPPARAMTTAETVSACRGASARATVPRSCSSRI